MNKIYLYVSGTTFQKLNINACLTTYKTLNKALNLEEKNNSYIHVKNNKK